MTSQRRRLAAVTAAAALVLGFAGCGGGGDGDGGGAANNPQERTEATKGGTVYSLEQAVTQTLDPQRVYSGRDISYLAASSTAAWVVFPAGATDQDEGSTPIPDLATDTGQSNEDATEWSFTLKDGPIWQDGQPITCEDFKYGVSRTFATDVITGGPNYILGYLDVPAGRRRRAGLQGPLHRCGPGRVRQGRDLRRQHDHLPVQEAVAGLPARHRRAGRLQPVPRRPGQGRRVQVLRLLLRAVHAGRRVERGQRRHLRAQPGVGRHRGHQSARPTRTASSSRSASSPRSSWTGSSPTRVTTRTPSPRGT